MNGKAGHRAHYPQFRSLLTWPTEAFRLLLYIPPVAALLLATVSLATESKFSRFVEMKKARIRELQAVKLTGAGAYYWKPLLQCGGIRKDLGTATDCLPLKFTLQPAETLKARTENFQIAEPMSGPCILCHREANASTKMAVYEFSETAPFWLPMPVAIAAAVLLAIFWYTAWGWFAWKRRAFVRQPLVALAMVSGRAFTPEWQLTRSLMRDTPYHRSLYSEWGGNYIRSVMTLAQFEHWLRYFFGTESVTGSSVSPEIPDDSLKIAAYLAQHPGGLPIPFESLRRAHLMAHRGISGSLLVEKQLLDRTAASGVPRSRRKAFWKTRQGEVTEFGILALLRNSNTQEDWSIKHA